MNVTLFGPTVIFGPLVEKYRHDWERDKELMRDNEVLKFYLDRREEGMSHNFAAMLACQRFPGTKTEVMYFEGRHTLADQFKGNEAQLEAVVAAAKRRGYTPGTYDVYEPGLGDDMGDPACFIKPSGGTTDVRRRCEAKGVGCEGLVKLKGRAPTGPAEKPGALAPDIVQELAARKLQENPDLRRKHPREIVEQINHEHGFRETAKAGQFTSQHVATTQQAVDKTPPPKTRPPRTGKNSAKTPRRKFV